MSVSHKPADAHIVLSALEKAVKPGLDLVALPETCLGSRIEEDPEKSDAVRAVRAIAKTYNVNIVLPLYISRAGVKRINTALVIDRGGAIVASYRKLYPYWSEYDLDPPCAVTDGGDCVAELDFGKMGLAICFDANFPGVWRNLYESGAEFVVWSSAYSAGAQLAAYSLIHHYPIVTCTLVPDAAVYDIDGTEVAYGKGEDAYIMEHTLDLDRCIFHYNFNQDKAEKLIGDHGADVSIEKDYWREQWFILRSGSAGVSARALAREYGMKELHEYQRDSRASIDAMRINVS